MQTTLIRDAYFGISLGLEHAPICPVAEGDAPVKLTQEDGTIVIWSRGDEGGVIRRYEPNGSITTWCRKPTLAEAVAYQRGGGYFKFNADGSVESRWFNACMLFWPADGSVDNHYRPTGTVEVAHRHENGPYGFEDECHPCAYVSEDEWEEEQGEPIPCRGCGRDIRGWDMEEYGYCDVRCWDYSNGGWADRRHRW